MCVVFVCPSLVQCVKASLCYVSVCLYVCLSVYLSVCACWCVFLLQADMSVEDLRRQGVVLISKLKQVNRVAQERVKGQREAVQEVIQPLLHRGVYNIVFWQPPISGRAETGTVRDITLMILAFCPTSPPDHPCVAKLVKSGVLCVHGSKF